MKLRYVQGTLACAVKIFDDETQMQVVSQVVALETLKSSEIEEDILMLLGYGPLSTGILDLLMYPEKHEHFIHGQKNIYRWENQEMPAPLYRGSLV